MTRAAFACFIDRYVEIRRQYELGCYPGDELVSTAMVLMGGGLWPAHGAMVGQSLKRQIEVTRGTAFPWPQPCVPPAGGGLDTSGIFSRPRRWRGDMR